MARAHIPSQPAAAATCREVLFMSGRLPLSNVLNFQSHTLYSQNGQVDTLSKALGACGEGDALSHTS